jgi:hypothetical protein
MARTPRPPLLAVRVPAAMKLQFDELAHRHGLSTSALLLRMVGSVLESENGTHCSHSDLSACATQANSSLRGERFSLRLRPGDRPALEALASARGLRPATYLTCLVHSHLHACPALPLEDLAAMKLAASHLAAIARQLTLLQTAACAGSGLEAQVLKRLWSTSDEVVKVRACVGEVVRANLRCWERGHV